jgi:hypothetical protein
MQISMETFETLVYLGQQQVYQAMDLCICGVRVGPQVSIMVAPRQDDVFQLNPFTCE